MLGLLVSEDNQEKIDYASLIQKFNRWLMTAFASEDTLYATGVPLERDMADLSVKDNGADGVKSTGKKVTTSVPSIPPLTQVSALKGITKTECMSCHGTTRKDFLAHVVDLVYPRPVSRFLAQQNRSIDHLSKGNVAARSTEQTRDVLRNRSKFADPPYIRQERLRVMQTQFEPDQPAYVFQRQCQRDFQLAGSHFVERLNIVQRTSRCVEEQGNTLDATFQAVLAKVPDRQVG